ncbi:hypothetical protein HQN89_26295 [Paenibacillus frigoriresistens]|uniref:hypothetical protein n=1 Tax=Paenibacillus alginolyticus TaxID=59839 RepID=UPI0015637FD6|nr:hypothetical protein [Paenibacillus frigoriresistens]NRF94427.1 hypothetical protein [Paenibacillus frigoriresistens]
MFQHNDPQYEGHDLLEIRDYFQQIIVFELDQNSIVYEATASQLFGYLFSLNSENLFLQYTPEVLSIFTKVFISKSDSIYYHNLAKSLISVHWKDSFLEVYRCIESVFHTIEYIEIYNQSRLEVSLKEFSKMIETSIGHKPSEEQSLITIFKNVNTLPIELIQKIKPASYLQAKDATWFYSIRNSIVHSRPAVDEVSFDTPTWNILLLASLHIVEQCHEMYGLQEFVSA